MDVLSTATPASRVWFVTDITACVAELKRRGVQATKSQPGSVIAKATC